MLVAPKVGAHHGRGGCGDDHGDENDGEGEGALDVADGGADGEGAVEDDGGVNALGNGGLDGGRFGADAVGGVNNVGAGLAEDDEQNGALAVQIAGGADVLYGIDDFGDVGEVDGGAFVVADDDGLEVFGVGYLIVGDNVSGGDTVCDLALGEVGVLQAQDGLNVRHGEAVAGELGGIHFDADGWQCAAADVDLADALNLGELLLDDGGSFVVELVWAVFFGGKAQDHDGRVGRIDFAVGGIRWEIGGAVGWWGGDWGFGVGGGAVDIAGEIKLDGDGGCAEAAAGGHLRDTGDVTELAFERSGRSE